jgi:hypothetical protein
MSMGIEIFYGDELSMGKTGRPAGVGGGETKGVL